ncbi:Gp49 family protein [Caballeronia sp. LZ034LL]|uniref:Gp49 family protein n=1 Tax=Caballeronia sp. LZ034LL TaxID=3038567 RepID=UPI00285CBD85|nr:Gp49 family protein [Caballeronia sp. LZ034LL]MDR5839335.1 Gp49 family protein [Caballeronia sp. LZ034LL]
MEVSEEKLAAVAKAPRVSLADVERAIRESKVTYTVLPNGRTTVCQIELFGGRFSVEGQSACVSKENFNQEMGEKFALERATDEVWKALGTVLAWRLSKIDAAPEPDGQILSLGSDVKTYVGTKAVHAKPATFGDWVALMGIKVDEKSRPLTDEGYLVQYPDSVTSDHSYYMSWSPKGVFERSYSIGLEPRETTYIERLQAELQHEAGKLAKLERFLLTQHYDNLKVRAQRRLMAQKACMQEYVWILEMRLKDALAD